MAVKTAGPEIEAQSEVLHEVTMDGVRFYYEARAFKTEKRSHAVMDRFKNRMGKDPVSVWRMVTRDGLWVLVILSENLSTFHKGLDALSNDGAPVDPPKPLIEVLAARRLMYLHGQDLDIPPLILMGD
jgi:hypothetical protein